MVEIFVLKISTHTYNENTRTKKDENLSCRIDFSKFIQQNILIWRLVQRLKTIFIDAQLTANEIQEFL